MDNYNSIASPLSISNIRDINPGIILVSSYFVLDFGSFQGLYPIVNVLKLPYIISVLSILYLLFLLLFNKLSFKGMTTYIFSLLCIYIIVYAFLSTRDDFLKTDLIKLFVMHLVNFLIIMSCVKKPSQIFLLIDIWLICLMFSSFHGIRQGGLVWGNRWLKDQNHISLVAATALPFAFYFFKIATVKIKKYFYAIGLFLFVSVNIIAASRGGALGLALVMFFIWLFNKHKLRNVVIFLIILVLVISFAPPYFFEELQTLEQGTQEATAYDRVYLWGIGLEMFSDHPLLGVGPHNYPYYFSSYERGVHYDIGEKRVAHSTPVQWLAEMGILGMLILILLQIYIFKGWKSVRLYNKIVNFDEEPKAFVFFDDLNNANVISQMGFWFCSLFLSLMAYPFYWILVPFGESLNRIFFQHIREKVQKEDS